MSVAFSSLVVLTVLGIFVELFAGSWSTGPKLAVLAIVALIAAFTFVVQFWLPPVRVDQQYEEELITLLLETLVARYQREHDGNYTLRANVMKVRKNWFRFHEPLKIDYRYRQDAYLAEELRQQFVMGTGCCGWCFEVNEQTTYDKALNQEALRGMTQEQRDATDHVHSILSTPIYRPNHKHEPIGILNLDSPNPIGETGFRNGTMQDLVARYASIIGTVLR